MIVALWINQRHISPVVDRVITGLMIGHYLLKSYVQLRGHFSQWQKITGDANKGRIKVLNIIFWGALEMN